MIASAWALARFARPSRPTLVALESGVTLALVLAYVQIALADAGGPLFSYAPT